MVVMDIQEYERLKNRINLESDLLRVRDERLSGAGKYLSLQESSVRPSAVMEKREYNIDNNAYAIAVREECLVSFENHLEALANVNISDTENLYISFWDVVVHLAAYPDRNPLIRISSAPEAEYRRALFGQHHAILYEVADEKVFIDAVVDLRQNIGLSLL